MVMIQKNITPISQCCSTCLMQNHFTENKKFKVEILHREKF